MIASEKSLKDWADWCVSCAGGNIPDEAQHAYEVLAEISRLRAELAEAREKLDLPTGGEVLTGLQLTAATFAVEALAQVMRQSDQDAATVAMGKAFMAALRDPLDESLDWLRADPEAGKSARAALVKGE